MERRTVALALGALVLVPGLAGAFLATYPFSYDAPHSADPRAERFTVDLGEEFRLTGSVVADGERLVEYEAVRAADGRRYEFVETDAGVTEVYRAEPGGELYRLHRYPDEEAAASTRSAAERDEGRTLVAEERVDGDVRLLVVEEDPGPVSGTVEGAEVLLHNGLQSFTAFGRVESDGETSVYEPRTGWYRHSELTGSIRVTDASGRVTVDAETNAVQSADVSVRYTAASSYLEYARARGDAETVEATVDVAAAPASIDEPDWVEEVRARR